MLALGGDLAGEVFEPSIRMPNTTTFESRFCRSVSRITAGLWMMRGLVDGYGDIGEGFTFRTVIQTGAPLHNSDVPWMGNACTG